MLAVIGALGLAFVVILALPNLPSIDALTDYQPKIPLRVFSAEGLLIGEFGEERRSVVKITDVPDIMKHAILAAEDEGKWIFVEGNYQDYEADKRKRLGEDGARPHRLRYKPLMS